MDKEIIFKPIGHIESEFQDREEIPKQSVLTKDKVAKIILNEELLDGIYGLKEGDDIMILFYFHQSEDFKLKFNHHSGEVRGVFNTRSPNRPNGIGISIVNIKKINRNLIYFSGVDMVSGTPVLDIKPYIPELNTSN
ncbi:MAG: tRNA (N6-threonylcarbamoyladenosine(37)-N6)-methyltransferase TrmO [Tissierellia bacterium]|nr:tRNA (N6-threonylcarbamoyladenosine(37)-N6)-methyltransferase TrmO [Tissierellia bacterium]